MSIATIADTMDFTEQETPEPTPSILARIADGQSQAVDACLDAYGALVWSLANRYCSSRDDAEDATQDIFVEIWQKAHRFDPAKSSESTFISMIARRRLIDRYRKQAAHPDTVSMQETTIELPDADDQSVELEDEARKAAGCFKKLPEQQRTVLSLSIQQGYSHGRIATALSIPLGTVKTFARRSLLQLRECMQRGGMPSSEGGAS